MFAALIFAIALVILIALVVKAAIGISNLDD
jgi:hypothetical protein